MFKKTYTGCLGKSQTEKRYCLGFNEFPLTNTFQLDLILSSTLDIKPQLEAQIGPHCSPKLTFHNLVHPLFPDIVSLGQKQLISSTIILLQAEQNKAMRTLQNKDCSIRRYVKVRKFDIVKPIILEIKGVDKRKDPSTNNLKSIS